MNEYILCVLDRKSRTEEELDINANAANIAADAAAAAATDIAAAYAAYNESAYVAYAAADAVYYDADADVEYWLNEYFEATGESRGDYEIEADRRSRKKERSNG